MTREEFSKYVIPEIINHFPDLVSFCSAKPEGTVEINYPSKEGKLNLWLTTRNNEITIGFADGKLDCWHTHMELLGAKTPREEIVAAVNLIDKIIFDKTLIVYSSVLGYFLSDNLEAVHEYQLETEVIDFFYWSQL